MQFRVARALGELPRTDAALSRGEISYCKVRAITRVATPAIEATLLDMAACIESLLTRARDADSRAPDAGLPPSAPA